MNFPSKTYDIIYADPPWPYWGDPNKNAAAGKHYDLMTLGDICAIPVSSICNKKAVLFLWATSYMMDVALLVMEQWEFHYRGVAFVWVKTAKDGHIIHGQGVRPSFTKPTTEFLLVGSTNKKGRTFPILNESMGQVVLAPRGEHSAKPDVFRDNISRLFGYRSRIELFARKRYEGWDAWGKELGD